MLSGPLPIRVAGETTLATKEPGEPNHAGNVGGHSVWYEWTPTYSGVVEISTCEAEVQMVLAVYTGDGFGSDAARLAEGKEVVPR